MSRFLRGALAACLFVTGAVATTSWTGARAAGETIIQGVITDVDSGLPLAGIDIGVVKGFGVAPSPVDVGADVTDGSGAYSIDISAEVAEGLPFHVNIADAGNQYGSRFYEPVAVVEGEISTFDAALGEAGLLQGTVISPQGAPVEASCVTVTDLDSNLVVPYEWWGTCSDLSGFYTLPGLPAGHYLLSFGTPSPGQHWELLGQQVTVVAGETTWFLAQLPEPPTTTISGEVTDSSAVPLAGVEVAIRTTDAFGDRQAFSGFTNATGSFSVDVAGFPFGADPFIVDFLDTTGTHAASFGHEIYVQAGYSELIGIALDDGGTVGGFIRDEIGDPLPGACVLLQDPVGNPAVPTDFAPCAGADGSYETWGVAPGNYQAYVLAPEGYVSALEGPFTVSTGASTNLDVTLAAFPPTLISGVVSEAGFGPPLADVEVAVRTTDVYGQKVAWSGTSNAAGEYTVDVSDVEFVGDSFIVDYLDTTGTHAASFGLELFLQPGYTELVSLGLQPGGTVTGMVTDENGDPLANACITFRDGVGEPVIPTDFSPCTGPDGVYQTWGVVPGTYQVDVFAPLGFISEQLDGIVVATGAASVVDVALAAFPPTQITGTITDSVTLGPITDVEIAVRAFDIYGQKWAWSGTTDASGNYDVDLELPFGIELDGQPYIVDVLDPSGSHAAQFGFDVYVQPGYAEILTVSLDPGGAFMGVITDEFGSPLAGVCAVILDEFGGAPEIPTDYAPCTGATGAYTTWGVAAGDYVLEFQAPPGYWTLRTDPVAANTGGLTTVDVSLAPVLALISGVVTEADGTTPVPGVTAAAIIGYDGDSPIWVAAATDLDGVYVLDVTDSSLGGAPILVDFVDPAGQFGSRFGLDVYVQPGYTEILDVSLEAGGPISGEITDTTGAPVVDACLDVRDGFGEPVFPEFVLVCSSSDGSYDTLSLPAGDYIVDIVPSTNVYIGQADLAVTVVPGGTTFDVVLGLRPPSNLSGYVYDNVGTPVDGATVQIVERGTLDVVAETVSEPTGFYNLTVAAGEYDLLAKGPSGSGLGAFVPGLDLNADVDLDIPLDTFGVVLSGSVVWPWVEALTGGDAQLWCSSESGGVVGADGLFFVNIVPSTGCYLNVSASSQRQIVVNEGQPDESYVGDRSERLSWSQFDVDVLVDTSVSIEPAMELLTVSVVDPDGVPAEVLQITVDSWVSLPDGSYSWYSNWNQWDVPFEVTGEVFPVADTSATVTVYLANGLTLSETIDTTNGANVVVQQPAPAVLSGSVVWPWVEALTGGDAQLWCSSESGGVVGADGLFFVNIVPSTGCYLNVSASSQRQIVVNEGQPDESYVGDRSERLSWSQFDVDVLVDTSVSIEPAMELLTVSVVDPDGVPAEVLQITVDSWVSLPDGSYSWYSNWNQWDVPFEVTGEVFPVADTSATVTVYLANGLTLSETIDTTNGANVVVQQPAPAVLSGSVVWPWVEALTGGDAQLWCSSESGGVVGADGLFFVNIVPSTGCYLNVSASSQRQIVVNEGQPDESYVGDRSERLSWSQFDVDVLVDTSVSIEPAMELLTVSVVDPDGVPAEVLQITVDSWVSLPDGSYSWYSNWNQWDVPFEVTGEVFPVADTSATVTVYLANGLTLSETIDTTNGANVALFLIDAGVWLSGAPGESNDGDNVDDVVEALAPNGGDGNGDGSPDYEQANVTSLPSSSGNYVTIAAAEGLTFGNVRSIDPYNDPVVTTAPPVGYELPEGLTDFRVDDVPVFGQDVTVSIYTQDLTGITGYAKYQDDAWLLLASERVAIVPVDENDLSLGGHVDIRLTDGGVGDDDLIANGSIVDPGGLVRVTFVDETPPVVTSQVLPGPNILGWNNTPVTVAWSSTDLDPSSGQPTDPPDTIVDTEGADQTILSEESCDGAGNCTIGVATVSIDVTPPSISWSSSVEPNANGWYDEVTFVATCLDVVSGVASCAPDVTLTDGASQSVSGTVTDVAGNSVTSTVIGVNVDTTDPVVILTGPTSGAVYTAGSELSPVCSTTDAVSGVAQHAELSVEGGNSYGVGTLTATCDGAIDVAGNAAAAVSVTYDVRYALADGVFTDGPVVASPAVNLGKAGRTYPLQWTLADPSGALVSDLDAVLSIRYFLVTCLAFDGVSNDVTEASTAGNSALTLTDSDEYKYNWKTPKKDGCYLLAIQLDDGSSIFARFELK